MSDVDIRMVAARAGVSVGTVSNYLNGTRNVAPRTAERVREAVTQLGYVRNDAARQLRAGSSRTVAFIVMDSRNPFFADVARGAEDEAARRSLSVVTGNSGERADREEAYLDLFAAQRVRGLLVAPSADPLPKMASLRQKGIPSVLVDRISPDAQLSSVSVDDVAGGRIAVEHLRSLGRRRMLFVGGPIAIRQVADRWSGARTAAAETHGDIELSALWTTALTVTEGRLAGARIAAMTPPERPDAIFAANDLLALGLIEALHIQSPLRIPDDIALIGYDDIDFAASALVPLTSVRQSGARMGQEALRILAEEWEDPTHPHRQLVFEPELIIRESAAAPVGG